MKKKFLVTLTPPKLTKQLKEEIEKDVPIVSQKEKHINITAI